MRSDLIITAARALAHGPQDTRDENANRLQSFVLTSEPSAIINEFTSLVGTSNAAEYLSAVCTGTRPALLTGETPSDLGKCALIRLALFRHTITAVLTSRDPTCTSEQAAALVTTLNDASHFFTGAGDLSIITELALEAFESDAPLSPHALDILPPVLATLHAVGAGGGDAGEASDVFYGVVRRICDHPWPAASIANVLASLRALPMSVQAREAAVRRGAARARTADVVDLPAIVHQLLTLAGTACRDLALLEIVRLFDRLEASATPATGAAANENSSSSTCLTHRRRLFEVEGSVLLHLEMAIKHDADMGKAWLKRLRDGSWRPTPFSFAFSLVVAGTERLEHHVISALSACLVKASKEAGKWATVPWLSDAYTSSGHDAQSNMEEALLMCARNARHGHGAVVVQPLVSLAVSLLEAEAVAGEKSGGGGAGALLQGKEQQQHAEATAAGNLGIRVLVELFASHKECRKDVLALSSGRLAGSSDAGAEPYIRLISELVRQHPALVEAHLPEIRSALENLSALPPAAAMALLLALWPLCKARRDISDFVVILLRKAMLSRELSARLLAARGLLFIITEELATAGAGDGDDTHTNNDDDDGTAAGPSTSHAMPALSQMGALAGGPGGGATLLHELMGFLRRCLAQQPEVRAVIYDGLPGLLQADPVAAEAVAELLLPHVAAFYEQSPNMVPLKVEACAVKAPDGSVRVIEPLHWLLACVRCVLRSGAVLSASQQQQQQKKSPTSAVSDDSDSEEESEEELEENAAVIDDDDGASAGAALRRLFLDIRRRLGSCELEDFNFDQSTEFSLHEAQGELNQANAHMLLGCYEVAIEDVINDIDGNNNNSTNTKKGKTAPSPARSEALAAELVALFERHKRLSKLVVEGLRGSGKAKKVEGLTQAVGGGGTKKLSHHLNNGTAGSVLTVLGPLDQRVPLLTVPCFSRLLESIVEDGLVPGGHPSAAPPGEQSGHLKLARDVSIQTFVMTGCLRVLQVRGGASAQALHSLVTAATAAETTTTSSAKAAARPHKAARERTRSASETVRALFGVPDWRGLSAALFRAAQMIVLACSRSAPPAANGNGNKKEKDRQEALIQAAVAALEQLIVCSGGNLEGLASLLQHVPLPNATCTAAAALPLCSSSSSAAAAAGEDSPLAIVSARLPHFKQLLDVFVKKACGKELISMTHCLQTFLTAVPPAWASAMSTWLDTACATAPEALSHQPTAVKALMSLLLKCHAAAGRNRDVVVLTQLANDMSKGINDDASEENDGRINAAAAAAGATLKFPAMDSNPLLSSKTLNVLFLAATTHLDATLVPLEWALSRLKPSGEKISPVDEGEGDGGVVGALVQGAVRADWEKATFQRLKGVAEAASVLSKVRYATQAEAVAKCLTRVYRTLGNAVKTQLAAKGQTQLPPGRYFQELAQAVNVVLTPAIYELKGELQNMTKEVMEKCPSASEEEDDDAEEDGGDEEENEAGNGGISSRRRRNKEKGTAKRAAAMQKAQKDSRILPGLIYQVEEWEKFLIKLGKVGKINLMLNAKRATNWDFRINNARKSTTPAAKRQKKNTAAAADGGGESVNVKKERTRAVVVVNEEQEEVDDEMEEEEEILEDEEGGEDEEGDDDDAMEEEEAEDDTNQNEFYNV